MAADGKWVSGLSADTPSDVAARQVLAGRLGVVKHYLPLAAKTPDEDVEYVHQLRVATRRSGAALRIFGALYPRKRLKLAKNVLRTVRRAAGGARDWDVFLEMLDGSDALRASGSEAAVDFLTGYAFGHRAAAQEVLKDVAASHGLLVDELAKEFPGEAKLHEEDTEAPRTFGELAKSTLAVLFAEFAAEIAANPTEPEELHQLRITGKRVRYAMEVFAGCFAPPFRDVLYPAVERVQEILGHVQDGYVATDRLARIKDRVHAVRPHAEKRIDPGLDGLNGEFKARLQVERKAFRQWVRQWTKLTDEHPLNELMAVNSTDG